MGFSPGKPLPTLAGVMGKVASWSPGLLSHRHNGAGSSWHMDLRRGVSPAEVSTVEVEEPDSLSSAESEVEAP